MKVTWKTAILLSLLLLFYVGCSTTPQGILVLTVEDMVGTWTGWNRSVADAKGNLLIEEDIFGTDVWVTIQEDKTVTFHAPDSEMTGEGYVVEDDIFSGEFNGQQFSTEYLYHEIERNEVARYSLMPSLFDDERYFLLQHFVNDDDNLITTIFIGVE